MHLDGFLSRLDGVKQVSGGWKSICPAHADDGPSLSIKEGDDGKILLYCFAGCTVEAICEAIGVDKKDLFVEKERITKKSNKTVIYSYVDLDGKERYQVVRRVGRDGKKKLLCRHDCPEKKTFVWSLGGDKKKCSCKKISRILYKLRELVASPVDQIMFLVEGEKDVDTLCNLELVATSLKSWENGFAKHFKARNIVVIPDNDSAGELQIKNPLTDLLNVAASVHVLRLPGLNEKGDVTDWLEAGGTKERLLELVTDALPAKKVLEEILEKNKDTRPIVQIVWSQLSDMVDTLEILIAETAPPEVFQRGGTLVRVLHDAKPPKGVTRQDGSTSIGIMPRDAVYESACRVSRWEESNGENKKEKLPPDKVVSTLIARGQWAFPVLEGISRAPVLRVDGEIVDKAGYDGDTGFFLDLRCNYPHAPHVITRDDVFRHIEELYEVFCDFPFAEDHHRSAAIAAVLSIVGRGAIDGPVPIFGITAPTPGTGKTYLADAISCVATGICIPKMSQTKDYEEEKKRLMAIAIEGDPVILYDNIDGTWGSPALEASATAGMIKDRILGSSETRTLPWRTITFVTGNNLMFRTDTARRIIPIVLDPQVEHPEERTGWKHYPLIPWVIKEHPKLIIAALSILRAFYQADRPQQERCLVGSFEAWDVLVRGCLLWLGQADPAAGREQVVSQGSPQKDALRVLLLAWYDAFGSRPILIRDAIRGTDQVLRDALGGLDSSWEGGSAALNAKKIGKSIARNDGVVVGGLRFISENNGKHGKRWMVQATSEFYREEAVTSNQHNVIVDDYEQESVVLF